MAKQKTKVTLVGVVLAKPGLDFVYEGSVCRVRGLQGAQGLP